MSEFKTHPNHSMSLLIGDREPISNLYSGNYSKAFMKKLKINAT